MTVHCSETRHSAGWRRLRVTLPRSDSIGNRHGLDLLRQTIAALYPPEFADERFNAAAGEASVDEAAGWVATLIERWH